MSYSSFSVLAAVLALASCDALASGQNPMLKELGLKEGQRYASAKAWLLKGGWAVDMDHADMMTSSKTPVYGFKEVVCGNGWQAVCSARFLRKDREIMVTMRPKKELLIEGAWDDK